MRRWVDCHVQFGQKEDTVLLTNPFEVPLPAGSPFSFEISNVRNPMSTALTSGYKVTTLDE